MTSKGKNWPLLKLLNDISALPPPASFRGPLLGTDIPAAGYHPKEPTSYITPLVETQREHFVSQRGLEKADFLMRDPVGR